MNHITITRAGRAAHRDNLNIEVVTCQPVAQAYVDELIAHIRVCESAERQPRPLRELSNRIKHRFVEVA